MDETKDVVYRILRLLKENVIKILMAIRENDGIRWKDLQNETGLPTATFNRALSALQEINFIKKDDEGYHLTWTGKLVTDGLIMLGWRMADHGDVVDKNAEELLAKDVAMAIIVLIFISIKRRGRLDFDLFEKELMNEMEVAREIFKEYEEDGFIEFKDGELVAKEKMKLFDISSIFK
ncbi:MAG: winged helix-turn-helix transcriptional regulator [Thermoplasmata archaeon]|nr:winged helix-turn-helix transcriptional regulator [Thermoplasmata archaeon]